MPVKSRRGGELRGFNGGSGDEGWIDTDGSGQLTAIAIGILQWLNGQWHFDDGFCIGFLGCHYFGYHAMILFVV